MKTGFERGRMPLAIACAVVLCSVYGAFLARHFGSAGTLAAPLTVTARFERNWTEWIRSRANRETGSPGPAIPADDGGIALPFPDPLFARAVEIVLESRRGSVSLLQRRLAIGYTRSSRLIDLMGIAGIIFDHKD